MNADLLNGIDGGSELLSWFEGEIPTFHDAEILTLSLDRQDARCAIKIHGFRMNSTLDSRGYFLCDRHAVFTLNLTGVTLLELDDFNGQNAILGLSITGLDDGGYGLELDAAYGIGGRINAKSLSIAIEPGMPPDSHYGQAPEI